MNKNENFAINEELIAEKADFLKAVVGAKTVEEAKRICSEYHEDFSAEMWAEIEEYSHIVVLDGDELSEDALDNVAGGKKLNGGALMTVVGIVGGIAGGPVGVLCVCATLGYYGYRIFN